MLERRKIRGRRGADVEHGALERLDRQVAYGCLGREESGVVEHGRETAPAEFDRGRRDLFPAGSGIAWSLVIPP
ncbi:hypothetical protein [Streptomyces alanosinicus]|uniref:Uncharacterized protein n=1 Tax=Streptomyces alanosinicus TaxID=68171 RepID=A0A919D3M1_9ACTN|nr:hypothetical protein [Streptomyces alanosinicus]GHE04937.1 hypothetical protein GCM10010339_38550 [Streptomyces alanosinicus]